MKKYEFTGETKVVSGHTLHRIRAVSHVGRYIVPGEVGGWIESERNLSDKGCAWVYQEACVYDRALILDDAIVSHGAIVCGDASIFGRAMVGDYARVYGSAKVFDCAKIYGRSVVCGDAKVCGSARICDRSIVRAFAVVKGSAEIAGNAIIESHKDYMTFNNVWSSGRSFTFTRSNQKWKVGCFYGDGIELIAKAAKDSPLSRKCYAKIVIATESIYKFVDGMED